MKNKKGADGGAGGHVEVGVKVIRPSTNTLQQLKEETQKETVQICHNIYDGLLDPDTIEKTIEYWNDRADGIVEKAFAAGRDDRDDELWAACENTDTANFFSKLSAAAKEYKNL
ncbi:MAG: hypothetical protein KGJ13_12320 [Patescibacteria group bacterium]|nr:hypothetical protein [Patescibacteria group bacterium]